MKVAHIVPVDKVGPYRTGTLENLTVSDIENVLGFSANCEDDPDKVKYSWGFEVDGTYAAIWDYYNSHKLRVWSVYDPYDVLKDLFKGEK